MPASPTEKEPTTKPEDQLFLTEEQRKIAADQLSEAILSFARTIYLENKDQKNIPLSTDEQLKIVQEATKNSIDQLKAN